MGDCGDTPSRSNPLSVNWYLGASANEELARRAADRKYTADVAMRNSIECSFFFRCRSHLKASTRSALEKGNLTLIRCRKDASGFGYTFGRARRPSMPGMVPGG